MWDSKSAALSAKAFKQIIPIAEQQLNGKIISIEQNDDQITKLLDTKCGVDGLLIHNKGVYGIAHRVGYDVAWNTFTIRIKDSSGAKTEIDHLCSNGIKPYYHIQSYVKGDVLLSMAIAKTDDIVDYIEKYSPPIKTANKSGDKFTIIKWSDFKSANYKIKILKGSDLYD